MTTRRKRRQKSRRPHRRRERPQARSPRLRRNWCYDCHVLDAAFHSKEIAPFVNENYYVVHVNVGDYDKNLDLAKKYEIPLEKGVPSLAVLDPDGKLVVSQKRANSNPPLESAPKTSSNS